jgi:hypothetical protein
MRWRDGQVRKWMTRYVWQVLNEVEGSRPFRSRRDLGILEVWSFEVEGRVVVVRGITMGMEG